MFLFFYSRRVIQPYVPALVIAVRHAREPNMRSISLIAVTLCAVVAITARARSDSAARPDELILLERSALDRWGNGDPGGFLDTYAPEITYFDVATEHRLDSHAAMS